MINSQLIISMDINLKYMYFMSIILFFK